MNCAIKCHCGCSVSLNEKNINKLSAFSCPACGQELYPEYLVKARKCMALMEECKKVKHIQSSTDNFADGTSPFSITFEP